MVWLLTFWFIFCWFSPAAVYVKFAINLVQIPSNNGIFKLQSESLILQLNVKMPTIVGILLTFMSRINFMLS